MPIYEFRCRRCNINFEVMTFLNEECICPECKDRDIERIISSFAFKGDRSLSFEKSGCPPRCPPRCSCS